MSRELLQQALGALGTSTWDHTRAVGKQELITALRAALAQPEPVAWKCARCGNTSSCQGVTPDDNWCNSCAACGDMKPLYATPPAGPAPAICDAVAMPTNAQQAEAMMRVSSYWLQANAPELLRAMLRAPAPAPAVPDESSRYDRLDAHMRRHHSNPEPYNFAKAAAPAVPRPQTEQDVFEDWLASKCPSGDVDEVKRKWEASSELADFLAESAAPAVPLTDDMVEKEFVSRGDGRGQGLHPYWKSAFREGWHFARAMIAASPPAPAVAEPLSDERIDEIFEGAHENMPKGVLFRTFIARAIEQAHGIGGGGK